MSHTFQFASQVIGIVECPIVHQGNFSAGIRVGMGIVVRLSSVRGPSRVGNADAVTGGMLRMLADQVNAVGLVTVRSVLGQDQRPTPIGHRGQTRTVVAPVLENGQALEQKVTSIVLVGPHHAGNSTALRLVAAILLFLLLLKGQPGRRTRGRRHGHPRRRVVAVSVKGLLVLLHGCRRRCRQSSAAILGIITASLSSNDRSTHSAATVVTPRAGRHRHRGTHST
mmetsp:Transcript_19111/g.52425  ORF Transcript_19111/g.52425 Transcript_19111/m.52425 type:complete len:225 (-) Transcript_19111:40-714(-)